MVPRIMLHKRNGHRRPAAPSASVSEMLRLVHSVRDHASKPAFDYLRFAATVRGEQAPALAAQAEREVDSLKLALTAVMARSEAAFARGELADVRDSLDAMRAHADLAARLMARLAAATGSRATARSLVDLNEILTRALDGVRCRLGDERMTPALAPELPPVFGHGRQLEQALTILLTVMADAVQAGPITVESLRIPGALAGEDAVRVRISGSGAPLRRELRAVITRGAAALAQLPQGLGLDLYLACQILTEHGGVFALGDEAAGGPSLTVELPAV
jgi:C4-dicarboxylate-specific signal transduction histidine kinase